MKVLIIDDDQALCRSMQIPLGMKRHEARCVFAAEAGVAAAREFAPDLVFLDVNLPDQSGLAALPGLLADPGLPTVVIMTGETDNSTVVEAMRGGAFDFLRKPLDLDEILAVVKRVERLRGRAVAAAPDQSTPASPGPLPLPGPEMIGAHPRVVELHKMIGLLSRSRVTVLIQGESGTGKELAARILHMARNSDSPFVATNCSAVVPTLLESEFFGHEKGAFTGADRIKVGKLEYAGSGTLFLDEIGDMPMDLQAKLLRVLQEEEFVRVGGLEPIPLRARIVAATHSDLPTLVREGRFREDLFYRLSVATLHILPLRERRTDIPLLAEALLAKIATKLQCPRPALDGEAMRRLLAHDWPGNVRELENVLTRAVALTVDTVLAADDLQMAAPASGHARPGSQAGPALTLAEAEKLHVEKSLLDLHWNISRAARQLDISPTTLRKKISDYGLANPFE
jgi:two-component system response regulator AtoC